MTAHAPSLPESAPVGRPSKYDLAYCEQIVAHMAEGASATSFAAEIDVARSTLNKWADEHPEFSEALSRAKAKCAAWWEKVGRASAQDGTGNATMIVFGLKNMSRDDWQDKFETQHSGEFTVSTIERKVVRAGAQL